MVLWCLLSPLFFLLKQHFGSAGGFSENLWDSPIKKELQKSNPEETNAQSSLSASLRQDALDFNNITEGKEGGPRNLFSVH